MKNKLIIILISIAFISAEGVAQVISENQIYKDIAYLASDKLKGRRTGSKGEHLAAKYIVKRFKKLGITPKGNDGYFYKVDLKYRSNPHDQSSENYELIKAKNIVGFLNNEAEYTIVIGAHYDHLGLGHDDNSLEANSEGQIHNGADDNASGVAGILQLAQALKENGIKENYNFLFIAFTGEELGLLGSKKWCDNPTIPINKINCMMNMDMIGRLNDSTKRLMISGIGTSNKWKKSITSSNSYFSIKLDSSGTGPSDHTSFYNNDIPVLHFFSGQHSDYHKPSDDIEKINLTGTKMIITLMYDILMKINEEPKLNFYKTKSKMGKKTRFKVTLGIMPDYTAEVKGLRVDGVNKDRPAEKAGMKKGDIIIKMGDLVIDDIYAYMKALAKFKKGETTTVRVLRGKEEVDMKVTF